MGVVVDRSRDHETIAALIHIARAIGIIGGVLVAGAVVVGTLHWGHTTHIDTEAPGQSPPPAISQTTSSTTTLSFGVQALKQSITK